MRQCRAGKRSASRFKRKFHPGKLVPFKLVSKLRFETSNGSREAPAFATFNDTYNMKTSTPAELAELLKNSVTAIALTGAGISVESGIPDFRGAHGLWTRSDPMEYAHIDAFLTNPAKVWKLLLELEDTIARARPNPAHLALAALEQMGRLQAVITQNVDNLHQEGGSRNVIEFHGNARRFRLPALWSLL